MSKPIPTTLQRNCNYILKFVILGDSAVGKTNMLLRFTDFDYKPTHIPTIGVDFKIKIVQIENKLVKLQLWDTAGQQRFKTITQTYYKNASGIILVYSVTDRKSYHSISNWIMQIAQRTEQNIPKIIIGNKCDVNFKERSVSMEEGQQLAQKHKFAFFEVSAKQNINVTEAFMCLGKLVIQSIQNDTHNVEGVMGQKPKVTIKHTFQGKKNECCNK